MKRPTTSRPSAATAQVAAEDSRTGGGLTDMRRMPGHLMRRCQQIAVSVFLDECRTYDLTPLQFAVLAALAEGGPEDQVRLAGSLALDRTTIGVVVKNLEGRGLVERRPSEKDRRAKLISITSLGQALVTDVAPSVDAAQDRMLAPLTDQERRRFLDLLQKVADGNNLESRAPLKT